MAPVELRLQRMLAVLIPFLCLATSGEADGCNDPELVARGVCWPKCCFSDQIFDVDTQRCLRSSDSSIILTSPIVFSYTQVNGEIIVDKNKTFNKINRMEAFAKNLNRDVCPGMLRFLEGREKIKYLTGNQLLVTSHDSNGHNNNSSSSNKYNNGHNNNSSSNSKTVLLKEGFCLENFFSPATNQVHLSAFVCQKPEVTNETSSVDSCDLDVDMEWLANYVGLFFTVCGVVSLASLSLMLYFYTSLQELKNFQGSILSVYIVTIMLTTTLLLIVYNVRVKLPEQPADGILIQVSEVSCKCIGYALYFASMCMFCWMSVLCYDLFWTLVWNQVSVHNKKFYKRLIGYVIFGFATPTVMTVAIAVVDKHESVAVLPKVGTFRCFLSNEAARFYFNLPVSLMLCFNCSMFATTCTSLVRRFQSNHLTRPSNPISPAGESQRESADIYSMTLSSNESLEINTRSSRDQFFLILKLFLVMGISWLSEFVHLELHGDHSLLTDCNLVVEVIWIFFGGLNMLQGFIIFAVFILKKSIWKMIEKQHPNLHRTIKNIVNCLTSSQPGPEPPAPDLQV